MIIFLLNPLVNRVDNISGLIGGPGRDRLETSTSKLRLVGPAAISQGQVLVNFAYPVRPPWAGDKH